MLYWATLAISRSFDFKGRSSRQEFWGFFLIWLGFSITGKLADALFGTGGSIALATTVLTTLAMLATLIPLTVRRFHDINRSGWHIWTQLAPVVVAVLVLAFGDHSAQAEALQSRFAIFTMQAMAVWGVIAMVWPGTKGVNDYGPPYRIEEELHELS